MREASNIATLLTAVLYISSAVQRHIQLATFSSDSEPNDQLVVRGDQVNIILMTYELQDF